jgi:hypothetical protein
MYCEIRRNVKNPEAFKRINNLNLTIEVQAEYLREAQKKGGSP